MQDLLKVLRIAEESEETLVKLYGYTGRRHTVRVGPRGGLRWGHGIGRMPA